MSVVQTYYLTVALINLVLALAAIRTKGTEGKLHSVWFLSGSFLSFALSWLLYSLELTLPIEILSTILSTVFVWGLTVFSYKRCHLNTPWRLTSILFLCNISAQSYFTVAENIKGVLHTGSVFIPVAFSICGYLFLKKKPNRTPSDVVIAGLFFVMIIIVMIRSILLETSLTLFSLTSASTQIIWPVFSVALGIFSLQSFTEEAQNKLMTQSVTDELTGVFNRRMFNEQFAHLLPKLAHQQRYGALIYLDLNGFKAINDQYGHTVGDEILHQIGTRVKQTLTSSSLMFRIGGDEFAVLLLDAGKEGDLATQHAFDLAQQIQKTILLPIDTHGLSLEISCSIGIHILSPEVTNVPLEIGAADAAMYQAKKSKITNIMFSDFSNKPRYSVQNVGIPQIDEEHQEIDYYINALLDKKISFATGLPQLIALVTRHFRNELLISNKIGIHVSDEHKMEHKKILDILNQFDVTDDETTQLNHLSTIEQLLVQHIKQFDSELALNLIQAQKVPLYPHA
jgi:diguanylate cyclase (GGDEF)-like protein